MATVTNVRLVDDIDGSEADGTVELALDGKAYEIDLSKQHADELRSILDPYVRAARRTGGGSSGRRQRVATATAKPRPDLSAVREWAGQNGFEVSARGRLSAAVMEAYENRDSAAAAKTPVEEPAAEAPPAETSSKPKRRTRKVADPFDNQAAS